MKWPYEEWTTVCYVNSTLMFGHVPISSLKLNASLYSYMKFLNFCFSHLVKQELSKSIYLSNISLSVIYFLSSLSSNHGYLSVSFVSSSSFLNPYHAEGYSQLVSNYATHDYSRDQSKCSIMPSATIVT